MPRKPRVLDDSELEQVEKLAGMLTSDQLADFLGVSKTVFYDILKRQPEVSEHYKKGRAKVIGSIARSLVQKALDGDTTSSIFYLKTQAGWRERKEESSSDDLVAALGKLIDNLPN